MLKPHHFTYKCPLRISDLEASEGGYFCAKCSKDIHDLTDCSLDEVRELQRRKGSICGFVRAVGLTSMVSLAACSKSEQTQQGVGEPSTANPSEQQTVPVQIQPEMMGDICIPEKKDATKPPVKPETEDEGDAQAKADQDAPLEEQKPEIIKPEKIQIEQPILMGVICVPDRLVPEKDPEPLDPNREGSPG